MNRVVVFTMAICLTLIMAAIPAEALTPIQELGRALYSDTNLSLNRNQSCASCHSLEKVDGMAAPGFVDPENVSTGTPVSAGSIAGESGGLNAPSASYAAFSPFFHWESGEGLYVGGQFWNGRANSLAEQAAGPFLNPLEMAMPDKWSVVDRLRTSYDAPKPVPPSPYNFRRPTTNTPQNAAANGPDYPTLFDAAYPGENLGNTLKSVSPYDWGTYYTCQEAGNCTQTPAAQTDFPPGVLEIYDRMAKAIGEFEKTQTFNKFNSKFDYFLAGLSNLSEQEMRGLALFENENAGGAKCSLCHISQPGIAADGASTMLPLLTDFTYDNLGVPQNLNIAKPIDMGLGGRSDIAEKDPAGLQLGKHKVMSLRNIELTPPYGHNGVFKTLEQIVHFYNTRDVLPACDPNLGNNDPGFGTTCWPVAEVAANVNVDELGNLGLTAEQEEDVVAFLKTLSDRDPNQFPSVGFPFPPMP